MEQHSKKRILSFVLNAEVRFTEMLRNQRTSRSALNREGDVTTQPLPHILALSLDSQRWAEKREQDAKDTDRNKKYKFAKQAVGTTMKRDGY